MFLQVKNWKGWQCYKREFCTLKARKLQNVKPKKLKQQCLRRKLQKAHLSKVFPLEWWWVHKTNMKTKTKKQISKQTKKQMWSSGWNIGGSEDFFTRRHFAVGQVKKEVQASVRNDITAHKKKRKTDGGQRSTWSISSKNDQDKIKNLRICLH